ncbi:MAG: Rrf2 family transcriptional regulator [Acidimicrobiales bacterium]
MRLEITRRSDVATRALLFLIANGKKSKASDVAESVGATSGFLAHAMFALVQRGWVQSEPGPQGGYWATLDPEAVSVLDVIEAVEGPTDTGRCVLQDRPCSDKGICSLHVPWSKARADLLNRLSSISLSSLALEPTRR